MDSKVTILKAQTETRISKSGLPPDLLEKARHRVRLVALLIFIGFSSDVVIFLLVWLGSLFSASSLPEAQEIGVTMFSALIGMAVSAGLWLLTRLKQLRDTTILNFGLIFEVFICLVISIFNPLAVFQDHGQLPGLTWTTPVIIMFPLIIPCPPRRTLVTAIAAALTAPLGIALLQSTGSVVAGAADYFEAVFAPATGVLFAFFSSRVVYSLGLDVARARRMGSYELQDLLGKGGMGEVWRARHRMLARPAAIKLIQPEQVATEVEAAQVVLGRFEREAQATASLRSPHTIELYDFGRSDDGTFYYVMELLEGFDLETLIQQFGPVSAGRAVFFLRQVCHSLGEAHARGLIHRDIKPANIYACRYGREYDYIKVLDFGLVSSRGQQGDPKLTAEEVATGTPAYMAPEQALMNKEIDARSDLYALGCVAFWLLTGRLVFEADSALEMIVKHSQEPPPKVSEVTELAIPGPLEEIIHSCLEKDPSRRPQSADELDSVLAALENQSAWTARDSQNWWAMHMPVAVLST